ncbi:Lysosomal cystine transporter [Parasponia andersonii]|uniref:Cystinosin homolog n=1 Tax=Parasponia andersonii TaxID=3476 RepID=A0A2P5B5J5_PARAD|nr:Lysosomal cystine transporter [Parasponia andersonii]
MASWNSIPLEMAYEVLGWIAFVSWATALYPQIILNFRRKSVVGLNFDYAVLNLTKHSSYLIYNATLYFSPTVQKQYLEKYGFKQMIPVAANDVAFSTHSVLLVAFLLFQIATYEAFMNFKRKTTDGFSIDGVLFDFSGGFENFAQMTMQSIDQSSSVFPRLNCISPSATQFSANSNRVFGIFPDSWVNFYGNIGKTLLALISIFFDIIFLCQHFLLYSARRAMITSKISEEKEPLAKSVDHPEFENV